MECQLIKSQKLFIVLFLKCDSGWGFRRRVRLRFSRVTFGVGLRNDRQVVTQALQGGSHQVLADGIGKTRSRSSEIGRSAAASDTRFHGGYRGPTVRFTG